MPYQRLRRYLQTPPPITIDPAQRECDPPEDPNWPAPSTREEIEQLMRRLPHWAQVVCALTAAEMALPIWEEDDWVNENLSEEQIEAPSQAIKVTWQWLDGEVSDDELSAAKTAVWAAAWVAGVAANAQDPIWVPPRLWAGKAAAYAADATRTTTAATDATAAISQAVWAATRASGVAPGSTQEVVEYRERYREWWDLCRCRLAFILETSF